MIETDFYVQLAIAFLHKWIVHCNGCESDLSGLYSSLDMAIYIADVMRIFQ